MKRIWTGIALVLMNGLAMAQVGELSGAEISMNTAVMDPAEATLEAEGHWLAFSMPVLEGTRSPCCWKGRWNGTGEVGCSLASAHRSYGTRDSSPLAENVIVFSEIREGQVQSMTVVGESCPVEAGGARVTWMGEAGETATLEWLEQVARNDPDDRVESSALYALALHRDPDVTRRLYAIALDSNDELSDQAIFWLGQSRGEKGSQLLFDIARDQKAPRDARRQAIFWLANSDDDKTVAALTDLLTQ